MLLIFQVRYFPYNIFQVIFYIKYFPCRYYHAHSVLQVLRAPLGRHQRAQQDRDVGDTHQSAQNFQKRSARRKSTIRDDCSRFLVRPRDWSPPRWATNASTSWVLASSCGSAASSNLLRLTNLQKRS